MSRRLLTLMLAISIAFNVGFGVAFVMNRLQQEEPVPPCLQDDQQSPRFRALSERLQQDLAPLRTSQAEATRRLAELLNASEPDRQSINETLDSLAASGRAIHGLVVETILAQRDALPADKRKEFCRHVQRRLCAPWAGCEAHCDIEHEHQNQEHKEDS
jgi:hypothetical protein